MLAVIIDREESQSLCNPDRALLNAATVIFDRLRDHDPA
jgi:hypothetical protein